MSFNNILMLYYLTVLVYTKTTTHISISGGYFHRGVKDTLMSEKAQIYSEADKTALIEIKLDTYLVTLWVMNDVTKRAHVCQCLASYSR